MSTKVEFLVHFWRIPDVVWSGLLAAGITLFGVWLANRQNAARQVEQHAFDSRESSLDRTIQLRKEVYLPLAAALQGALTFLSKLSTSKTLDEKPLAELAAAASKLTVVAETSTAILVTEVNAEFGLAFMRLFMAAQPAIQATMDAERAKGYRVESNARAELTQRKIDEHLQAARPHDPAFEALLHDLHFNHERRQEHWAVENAALRAHAVHNIEYVRQLISNMPALNILSSRLLVALRRDMNIETEEDVFLKALRDQCARMIVDLEALLRHHENMLADLT